MRERSVDWLPPVGAQTGDPTRSPGTCPDLESHLRPFGSDGAMLRPTEPPSWGKAYFSPEMVLGLLV